jgi:hypothetical protein
MVKKEKIKEPIKQTYISRLYGADYVQILFWLEKHIGKMTVSKPVIYWEGNNWKMRLVQGKIGDSYCDVEFNNKKHLQIFDKAWTE